MFRKTSRIDTGQGEESRKSKLILGFITCTSKHWQAAAGARIQLSVPLCPMILMDAKRTTSFCLRYNPDSAWINYPPDLWSHSALATSEQTCRITRAVRTRPSTHTSEFGGWALQGTTLSLVQAALSPGLVQCRPSPWMAPAHPLFRHRTISDLSNSSCIS